MNNIDIGSGPSKKAATTTKYRCTLSMLIFVGVENLVDESFAAVDVNIFNVKTPPRLNLFFCVLVDPKTI
jgi:hypothetical protein